MAYEQTTRWYRHWYRALLRLYPKPYYERFGEGMEQMFGDMLREQSRAEGSAFGCALRVYFETLGGIINENIRTMNILNNNFMRIAIGTGLLLLIPLALQLTIGTGVDGQGFNWKPGDFVFAFILIFGVGSLFEVARRKASGNIAYKVAAALALAGMFLLIWISGAVGIIGSENNPANLLYAGVLVVGFFGAILARLQPQGMARTLFVMAATQFAVPLVALIIWRPSLDETPGILGVLALNFFFVMLFAGSALLFRQASETSAK